MPEPVAPAVAAPVAPVAPVATPALSVPVAPVASATPTYQVEPPTYQVEPPAPVVPAEPEIILTRDFLEEPIPGSGWHSTAPMATEDETVETAVHDLPVVDLSPFGPEVSRPSAVAEPAPTFARPAVPVGEEPVAELPAVEDVAEVPVMEETQELPVVEETIGDTVGPGTAGTDALTQAATVMSTLPVVESSLVDDFSRVDDLKSRIEETRRRIRHELEQPFDTSAPTKPLERDWTTSPLMPAAPAAATPAAEQTVSAEPVIAAAAAVAPTLVEEPAAQAAAEETVAVEPLPMESVVVEALPMEEVVAEPLAPEPPVVAEVPTATPVVAAPSAIAPVPVEPARVVTPVAVPAAEPVAAPVVRPAVAPAAEPVTVELPLVEPTPVEPVVAQVTAPAGPVVAQPVVAQPVAAAVPAGPDVLTAGGEAAVGSGAEEPVDYDSMKNRIESTRSRLKAKAFDAMMTGESALLGRDVEGSARTQGKVAGVDSDIDETIETSLREEEE